MSPGGRLTSRDNGKLGLRCIDRGTGVRSRMTNESRGKAYVEDDGKLGLSV